MACVALGKIPIFRLFPCLQIGTGQKMEKFMHNPTCGHQLINSFALTNLWFPQRVCVSATRFILY